MRQRFANSVRRQQAQDSSSEAQRSRSLTSNCSAEGELAGRRSWFSRLPGVEAGGGVAARKGERDRDVEPLGLQATIPGLQYVIGAVWFHAAPPSKPTSKSGISPVQFKMQASGSPSVPFAKESLERAPIAKSYSFPRVSRPVIIMRRWTFVWAGRKRTFSSCIRIGQGPEERSYSKNQWWLQRMPG